RASATCSVSPTTPRMSYSRRIVGSNLCAVWLIKSSECKVRSIARLGPADALIHKPQSAHLLGIEDVAQVDDAGLAHHLLDTPRIEAAELMPLRDHNQHVGAGRRLIGGFRKGDVRQQLAGFGHAFRIERDNLPAACLKGGHDVERRR